MKSREKCERADVSIAADIEVRDGQSHALSSCPWLKIEIPAAAFAGRWIEMTFESGLLDPLARPVLRCFARPTSHDQILPAALHGRAFWLGEIPAGTDEIWISPTNRPGVFAFRITLWRAIPFPKLVWRLFKANRAYAATYLWARSFGYHELARIQARRALGPAPPSDYDAWRKARLRPYDPEGFDRPGVAPHGPHFRIIVRTDDSDAPNLDRLWNCLRSQSSANWSLLAVTGAASENNLPPHVPRVPPQAAALRCLEGLATDDFIIVAGTHDLFPEYALDILSREACEHQDCVIFYGDEDQVDALGVYANPAFKPAWSPGLYAHMPYLGALAALKVRFVASVTASYPALSAADLCESSQKFDPGSYDVRHIGRILVSRPPGPAAVPLAAARAPRTGPMLDRGAAIIIPTRDRRDLIERCVETLRRHTISPRYEIIIADNGSADADARAYLDGLTGAANIRVLSLPGPFNFSGICNAAARQTDAAFLVFLNNDTEILDSAWLGHLLDRAARPEAGAVGAKLLYPDGRVQHNGVVIGIDGVCGHFQRGLAKDDPGYFGRFNVPHEVSAVTAACLAIEAGKFAAAGGFDEINLPVELNDIDLCLRLSERGLRNYMQPSACLIHHESASRGRDMFLSGPSRGERDYFRRRWLHVIRDDPYFHPALSLDSLQMTLG